MPKLNDFDNSKQPWSILSRGFTGSGKTIASCGKEFRPTYVFDLDSRMTSIAKYYRDLDGHCDGIEYDTYTMGMSFVDLDKKLDLLLVSCPYKTVVIASLTAYIHLVLYHLLNFKPGGGHKNIANIKVNELEDYLAEDSALIFDLIGNLMKLKAKGVNVILEAHLTNIEYRDVSNNVTNRIDTLTKGKKAPAAIPGYFDETWLFQKNVVSVADPIAKKMIHTTTFIMNPTGTSLIDAKTSRGVKQIDWTGKDFSVELMKQFKKD